MTVVSNTSVGLRKAWHPVVASSNVADRPERLVLLGEPYVLVRLAGKVVAFVDRCPHRNARLSEGSVVDGCLQCPYHGWQFDDTGSCVLVPALGPGATLPASAAVAPVRVTERYDFVWLAPDEPDLPILDVAEWHDPTLIRAWLPSLTIEVGAAQFIDNFLDFAHFPFVHAGTFGLGESPLIHEYQVQRRPDGFGLTIETEHTISNHEDPLVATGEHELVQTRRMRYDYAAPFTALLRLELPIANIVNSILVFCTPVDEATTTLHTVMLRNDCPTSESVQAAVDYELAILAEDLGVISKLPDRTLSLDLGAQVHTRVDRITVEYRRILARLCT